MAASVFTTSLGFDKIKHYGAQDGILDILSTVRLKVMRIILNFRPQINIFIF